MPLPWPGPSPSSSPLLSWELLRRAFRDSGSIPGLTETNSLPHQLSTYEIPQLCLKRESLATGDFLKSFKDVESSGRSPEMLVSRLVGKGQHVGWEGQLCQGLNGSSWHFSFVSSKTKITVSRHITPLPVPENNIENIQICPLPSDVFKQSSYQVASSPAMEIQRCKVRKACPKWPPLLVSPGPFKSRVCVRVCTRVTDTSFLAPYQHNSSHEGALLPQLPASHPFWHFKDSRAPRLPQPGHPGFLFLGGRGGLGVAPGPGEGAGENWRGRRGSQRGLEGGWEGGQEGARRGLEGAGGGQEGAGGGLEGGWEGAGRSPVGGWSGPGRVVRRGLGGGREGAIGPPMEQ